MKYIIFELSNGLVSPFVFPEFVEHAYLSKFFPVKAISAGFCSPRGKNQWECWGKSVSLGLESGPKDGEILSALLRFNS